MPNSSRGLSYEEARAQLGASYDAPSRGAYRPPEYRDPRTGMQINRAPLPMQTEPQTLVVGGRVLHAG